MHIVIVMISWIRTLRVGVVIIRSSKTMGGKSSKSGRREGEAGNKGVTSAASPTANLQEPTSSQEQGAVAAGEGATEEGMAEEYLEAVVGKASKFEDNE
jgi:hypothetical protein